jgi:hypothetical protein
MLRNGPTRNKDIVVLIESGNKGPKAAKARSKEAGALDFG